MTGSDDSSYSALIGWRAAMVITEWKEVRVAVDGINFTAARPQEWWRADLHGKDDGLGTF